LIISVFQTVTSVQEQTLTFVPKLVAIFAVLALFGNFVFGVIIKFTQELFNNFNLYIK
jgi:flagellar biosynthetic protein FliQ